VRRYHKGVPEFEKRLSNVIERITHAATEAGIEADCVSFLSTHGEPLTNEKLHEDSHVAFEELAFVPMKLSITVSLKTNYFCAISACLWCRSMAMT
jgi:hypothetical protein